MPEIEQEPKELYLTDDGEFTRKRLARVEAYKQIANHYQTAQYELCEIMGVKADGMEISQAGTIAAECDRIRVRLSKLARLYHRLASSEGY